MRECCSWNRSIHAWTDAIICDHPQIAHRIQQEFIREMRICTETAIMAQNMHAQTVTMAQNVRAQPNVVIAGRTQVQEQESAFLQVWHNK